MHKNDNWDGPIRGSRVWWRGMQASNASGGMGDTETKSSDKNIRWELVHRVRKEIAEGRYDSDQKWDEAMDRLLDDLA